MDYRHKAGHDDCCALPAEIAKRASELSIVEDGKIDQHQNNRRPGLHQSA
jgi:hypothetical protein